jgi:hypothetical protein
LVEKLGKWYIHIYTYDSHIYYICIFKSSQFCHA